MLALALAIGLPIASPGQAPPDGPKIQWNVQPHGSTISVSIVGLDSDTLDTLRKADWPSERWEALFPVAVQAPNPKQTDGQAMLGSYGVFGKLLRFTPRYGFDAGKTFVATFRPSKLPSGGGPEVSSSHLVFKPKREATNVTAVTPSGNRAPENLLKFYLYFSAPMSRGEVYNRVRLLKQDGQAVDLPFLRLGEELWDPSGTRLTLLIDPGRIKRGLRPREENGPVLEAGKVYTLVIDRGWPDAEGTPLGGEFRKAFLAGPPDESQPDPKTWKVARPSASTREPLVLTFPEPLDRALIESALTLVDAKGEPVDGHLEVKANETRWEFTPETPWTEGDYQLLVDADLEDLAGNSILRPFEVDVQRDTPSRPEAKVIRLPIAIRAKGR
jgi:hypothetical protein